MNFEPIMNIVMILVLTVISGFSDANGALHASKIWKDGSVVWSELGLTALGFAGGITAYILALRFLTASGIVAPELQTSIWYAVMIVGVALLSRSFFQWGTLEQVIGVLVVLGILWLSVRAGG